VLVFTGSSLLVVPLPCRADFGGSFSAIEAVGRVSRSPPPFADSGEQCEDEESYDNPYQPPILKAGNRRLEFLVDAFSLAIGVLFKCCHGRFVARSLLGGYK